jgi:hypothetical protein
VSFIKLFNFVTDAGAKQARVFAVLWVGIFLSVNMPGTSSQATDRRIHHWVNMKQVKNVHIPL